MIADFVAGTTKEFTVTITIDAVTQDIRLDTVELTLKRQVKSGNTTYSADVTTAGLTGDAIFTLTAVQTALLVPDKYQYELLWTRANGKVYVLQTGTVTIGALLTT